MTLPLEKNNQNQKRRSFILIMVPFPAQGHVTPMLNLASSFRKLGFVPLVVLPDSLHRRLNSTISGACRSSSDVVIAPIPDGDGDKKKSQAVVGGDFFTTVDAMENHMPAHLEKLIKRLRSENDVDDDNDQQVVVVGLVVDLLASWAIKVARECGVATVAGFWPASLATYHMLMSIPDFVSSGFVTETGLPPQTSHEDIESKTAKFHPNQPPITTQDLLWSIGTIPQRKFRFKFWVRTLDRSRSLNCILVNSFPDELNFHLTTTTTASAKRSFTSRQSGPKIYPVGLLTDHIQNLQSPIRNNCRLSFWEEDSTCLDWLDQHWPNSVVYVSFSSWFGPTNTNQVRLLAQSLEATNRPFLWALGPNWRDGLPAGYVDRVRGRGKVVAWAPQVAVLRHAAVGCFFTHCGWNSTVEAIRCRKRMLCYPIGGDQRLNCEYVVRVWRVGVEVRGLGEVEVEEGVRKVVEDDEMGMRVAEMSETAVGEAARVAVVGDLAVVAEEMAKRAGINCCPTLVTN